MAKAANACRLGGSGNMGLLLLPPLALELGRRQIVDGAVQPTLVHQSTHSAVAGSTCSRFRQGPRRRFGLTKPRQAVPPRTAT